MRQNDLERLLSHRTARDPILRTIRDVARELDAQAWLVGGMVRDAALGRRSHDADLATGRGTGRLLAQLRQAWGRTGFRFRKRGVTTWRFDIGGRRVDLVDASRRGLHEDLRRRDFTVNAIAYDLTAGLLDDPTAGLRDAGRGILRLPRQGVMSEDPVRALRAARFMAQLSGFRLHRDALREAESVAARLKRASMERVRDEWHKLMTADTAVRGIETAERLGIIDALLPELLPMRECLSGRERPSVWEHTLRAVEESCRYRRRPAAAWMTGSEEPGLVRWALLFHDISKPETMKIAGDGRPTFHGHEVLGADRAAAVMKRFLFPGKLRQRVHRMIAMHLRPYQLADSGLPPRGLRRLVRDAGDDLPHLLIHAVCDALGSGSPDAAARWRKLRAACNRLLELHLRRKEISLSPLVSGADVLDLCGIDPGPEVGEILEAVASLQAEGGLDNRQDALDYLRRLRNGVR